MASLIRTAAAVLMAVALVNITTDGISSEPSSPKAPGTVQIEVQRTQLDRASRSGRDSPGYPGSITIDSPRPRAVEPYEWMRLSSCYAAYGIDCVVMTGWNYK